MLAFMSRVEIWGTHHYLS